MGALITPVVAPVRKIMRVAEDSDEVGPMAGRVGARGVNVGIAAVAEAEGVGGIGVWMTSVEMACIVAATIVETESGELDGMSELTQATVNTNMDTASSAIFIDPFINSP